MGFLKWLSPTPATTLQSLPSGCFTVDSTGNIIGSTLPQTFPAAQMQQIGRWVIGAFHDVHQARLSVTEIQVQYPALKLTAREIHSGAIIFLAPRIGPPSKH